MKRVMFCQMAMVLFLCTSLAMPPGLMAQGDKEGAAALRPEEIDQLMAPIALYPDDLLAQVLAASTYPLEIVQAAWPAAYNVSGVMTFIVNQKGTVYAKDLGLKTEATVKAMTLYNPDRAWKRAQ